MNGQAAKNRAPRALVCFSLLFLQAIAATLLGPLVSVIEEHFHTGEAGIGALSGGVAAGFILAVTLSGYVGRKTGIKIILLLGSFPALSGLLLFSQVHHFSLGMTGMILVGISGGFAQIGVNAVILSYFRENRTFYMNLLHVFFGCGAVAGPRITAYFLKYGIGWQWLYILLSGLFGLNFISSLFVGFPAVSEKEFQKGPADLNRLSPALVIWIGAAAISFYVGAESTLNIWSPVYMERVVGITRVHAAANLSNFWLCLMIGRIICTLLAKKMSSRIILMILCSGAFLSVLIFVTIPAQSMAGISLAAAGLFFSGFFATLLALVGDYYPDSIDRITSIMVFTSGIGLLFYPWLAGIAAEFMSLRTAIYLPLILTFLLSLFSLFLTVKTRN